MSNPFGYFQGNCRILYLVGQLGTGGLERQLYYLLKAMDRVRYVPVVVVWNYREDDIYVRQIRDLGVQVIGVPKVGGGISKLCAFRRLVKALSPELVHSYAFYTNFPAWYATRRSSPIAIGSIRQNFLSEREKAGKFLGRLSARLPPHQICNSLAAKQTAEHSGGYWKPITIFLVRNRLDLAGFHPTPVPQGESILLAIGRLEPEKRWDRLLRCMAEIMRMGLKFQLFHAGDGPLRGALERQMEELGLNGKVHFLGTRRDIMALMQRSSFLVHTADDEGCPNVVMEAMACGRAVVATDAGDVPHLVKNGETGFVVSRRDDTRLVKSVAKLISRYDLVCRMGIAGRLKAEQEFGLDRLLSETFAVYRAAGWVGD